MGKNPAFQFYVNDFLRDTNLLSPAATGAWIRLLCTMHQEPNRGIITADLSSYARLFGTNEEHAERIIDELTKHKICDCVTERNGNITLISRRMTREEKLKETNRLRQSKFRVTAVSRKRNANVTSYSSSSSSFSKNLKEEEVRSHRKRTPLSDEEFLRSLEENETYKGIDVRRLYGKMKVWCELHKKKPTRRRFLNWLNREDPVLTQTENVGSNAKLGDRGHVPWKTPTWMG